MMSRNTVEQDLPQDLSETFGRYDGPSPEAIRKVAQRNELPVERFTQVSVLHPYLT